MKVQFTINYFACSQPKDLKLFYSMDIQKNRVVCVSEFVVGVCYGQDKFEIS